MVSDPTLFTLPHPDELPDSDGKPVDNELQILVPTLLSVILNEIWQDRQDWFFAVNMGIYHTTGKNPRIAIVPDGFLCLGIPRHQGAFGRPSYITWIENDVVPIFVLEFVSTTYGGEYDLEEKPRKDYTPKMRDYARLGVLYYAIYNPQYTKRDKHDVFEVYRLENGIYQRQNEQIVWMSEIGLGIGRDRGIFQAWEKEWLFWFNEAGQRYLSPEEMMQRERQNAERERQRAERLAELLREQGIDPDRL